VNRDAGAGGWGGGLGQAEFDAVVVDAGSSRACLRAGFGAEAAEFFDFGDGREDLEEVGRGSIALGEFEGAGVQHEGEGILDGRKLRAFAEVEEIVTMVERIVGPHGGNSGLHSHFAAVESGAGNFEAKAARERSRNEPLNFGEGKSLKPIAKLEVLGIGEFMHETLGHLAAIQHATRELVVGEKKARRSGRLGGTRWRSGDFRKLCRLDFVHINVSIWWLII